MENNLYSNLKFKCTFKYVGNHELWDEYVSLGPKIQSIAEECGAVTLKQINDETKKTTTIIVEMQDEPNFTNAAMKIGAFLAGQKMNVEMVNRETLNRPLVQRASEIVGQMQKTIDFENIEKSGSQKWN